MAANNGWDFGIVEMLVKLQDGTIGKLPLLQMFDVLVRMGDIQEDYTVGVEFENEDGDIEEGFYEIAELEYFRDADLI
jgi:hypothetical protein